MKNSAMAICLSVTALLVVPAFSQSDAQQGLGKAVVTILPKKDGAAPPSVSVQDLSLKIGGKIAKINDFKLFQSSDNIELVLLIDNSSSSSLGTQLSTIESFVKSLPPNIKAAIAYMQNGQADFVGPLSADHAQVLRALHLPGGGPGASASPYFCLSDLAKRWPSQDQTARREVVMVSDGVDPYNMRYDPNNPYLEAAISDSVRARLVVYSLYWESRGTGSGRRYQNMAGQSYLMDVTQATGGKNFWIGMGNPISFEPYFKELTRIFQNQYELAFATSPTNKPQVEDMKLKFKAPDADVNSPLNVMVYSAATAKN
jgi:hypothetical protein